MDTITLLLIAVTAIVSFMAFSNGQLFDKLRFNAYYIRHHRQWYRFLSHALLHADLAHLAINMLVFWSFAGVVMTFFSRDFGQLATVVFLGLYVGGVIFSSVYDYFKHSNDISFSAVGASGAVSAVVFSSIILYPDGRIFLFLIPIGIPSWIFGILYLAYSAYMGKRGGSNIGHNAHFWGAVFGIAYTIVINPDYVAAFFRQLGLD
ncbi:MAG: rhomboid family intramembrane serine protease [Clostridia bacterium]|nr:rhomboid family intramembrane serine protease [Clostridia bacterium]